MKYLKHFESPQFEYNVGDIIVYAPSGRKYKVLKIYVDEMHSLSKLVNDGVISSSIKQPYMRVDIEDLEKGFITKDIRSDEFISEIEFNSQKYNL